MVRTFAYGSLKRLLAAGNPENASAAAPAQLTCAGAAGSHRTACYAYDNVGNLLTKTDNRGTTATNAYDVLNRIYAKSYSDGTPGVSYTYDAVANSIVSIDTIP